MRKLLFLPMMMIFSSICAQNISVPKNELLHLIQSNENGKKAQELLIVERQKNLICQDSRDLLFGLTISKDSTIQDQKTQIRSLMQVISNDSAIYRNQVFISDSYKQQITQANKDLRKQKRKTFFVGAVGMLATAYLGAKLLF
jgi:hypothetical protein